MQERLRFSIHGPFRVISPDGVDITPRGTRAQAVLALLLTTPEMSRTRRWVEGKIWSTRGAEQASGSLRQALVEIRASFGSLRDILLADRQRIGLSREAITLLKPDELTAPLDLFEGLDIRDPAFEVWLKNFRNARAAQSGNTSDGPHRDSLHIRLESSTSGNRLETLMAAELARQMSRNLQEFIDLRVITDGAPLASIEQGGLKIKSNVARGAQDGLALLSVHCARTDRMMWSQATPLAVEGATSVLDDRFLSLAQTACEAALPLTTDHLSPEDSRRKANLLFVEALDEMFMMDAQNLRIADTKMALSFEMEPNPVCLAWRCMIREIQIVECCEPDPDMLLAEAQELISRALDMAPGNSTVLAISALLSLFLGLQKSDTFRNIEEAIRLNPGNAMAHMARSVVMMRLGQIDDAVRAADHATRLARNSRYRHWWDMSQALVELSAGNLVRATECAESAFHRVNVFRPPMRVLYALYLQAGRLEEAQEMLIRMRKLEPDFSLTRVREDDGYPALTLRASPLSSISEPW